MPSRPRHHPSRHRFSRPAVETLEARSLLATFTVSSTADAGPGTLRQAILDANQSPGADVIAFDIPGSRVRTIAPVSRLPSINDAVTIDGTTQPGFAGTPIVELKGNGAGEGVPGLLAFGSDVAIQGLVINQFSGAGIDVQSVSTPGDLRGGRAVIRGNFIGTDASGTIALGNGTGIVIGATNPNTIGGTDPGAGNLISGNRGAGISIRSGGIGVLARGNVIRGNLIGTDASGSQPLGNAEDGIVLRGAEDTTIGGAEPGAGNVISGNGRHGVRLGAIFPRSTFVLSTFQTLIQGNAIGTDRSGTRDLGNFANGIFLEAAIETTIGGTVPGARNVIRFNGGLSIFPAPGPEVVNNNDLTPNRDEAVDLVVAARTVPEQPTAGRPFVLVYEVTNREGHAPASDVTLRVVAPTGATLVPVATTQGTLTPADGAIVAQLGRLEVGRTATVALVVVPGQDFVPFFQASVTGGRFEIDPTNNATGLAVALVPPVRLAGATPFTNRQGIVAVRLTFGGKLDPTLAADPRNYRVTNAGRDGRFGTRHDATVPIDGVAHDPATETVTLAFRRPFPRLGSVLRITAGGPGTPGLIDLVGNPVLGEGDLAGGPILATLALGPSLRYVDRDGDSVRLRLARGGLIEAHFRPDGEAFAVILLGPVRGRSVLSGSVRRARRGDGRANLGVVFGLEGLDRPGIRLTSPPFVAATPLPPRGPRL